MLVVPVKHIEQIYNLDSDLVGPVMATLARVAGAVKQVFAADGVSIRQNNEPAAGQDVFHLHFHVVPRFTGDAFIGLDHSLGAVEVPVELRIQQSQKLAAVLKSLQ